MDSAMCLWALVPCHTIKCRVYWHNGIPHCRCHTHIPPSTSRHLTTPHACFRYLISRDYKDGSQYQGSQHQAIHNAFMLVARVRAQRTLYLSRILQTSHSHLNCVHCAPLYIHYVSICAMEWSDLSSAMCVCRARHIQGSWMLWGWQIRDMEHDGKECDCNNGRNEVPMTTTARCMHACTHPPSRYTHSVVRGVWCMCTVCMFVRVSNCVLVGCGCLSMFMLLTPMHACMHRAHNLHYSYTFQAMLSEPEQEIWIRGINRGVLVWWLQYFHGMCQAEGQGVRGEG